MHKQPQGQRVDFQVTGRDNLYENRVSILGNLISMQGKLDLSPDLIFPCKQSLDHNEKKVNHV